MTELIKKTFKVGWNVVEVIAVAMGIVVIAQAFLFQANVVYGTSSTMISVASQRVGFLPR